MTVVKTSRKRFIIFRQARHSCTKHTHTYDATHEVSLTLVDSELSAKMCLPLWTEPVISNLT